MRYGLLTVSGVEKTSSRFLGIGRSLPPLNLRRAPIQPGDMARSAVDSVNLRRSLGVGNPAAERFGVGGSRLEQLGAGASVNRGGRQARENAAWDRLRRMVEGG